MIKQNFTFDGITSESMGVSLVRQESGVFGVPYVSSRNIQEDYPSRTLAPYFFRTQNQPLSFTLTFTCLDEDIDNAKLKDIASWLFQGEYKPFISEDNTDKIYYIMATSKVDFMTNGFDEGYLSVTFRCKFPYAMSLASTPTYDSIYDFDQGSPVTTFTINNECNVFEYFSPIYEITVTQDTDIYIYNWETEQEVIFESLLEDEVIYVDNQKNILLSDSGDYVYDYFNKEWLRLVQGDNLIEIGGYCTIEFYLQFPIWV